MIKRKIFTGSMRSRKLMTLSYSYLVKCVFLKNQPHQNAAAIIAYKPIKATPSSQMDSPSNTTNALTITANANAASNNGLNTNDNTAPPKKNESKTDRGNKPSAT